MFRRWRRSLTQKLGVAVVNRSSIGQHFYSRGRRDFQGIAAQEETQRPKAHGARSARKNEKRLGPVGGSCRQSDRIREVLYFEKLPFWNVQGAVTDELKGFRDHCASLLARGRGEPAVEPESPYALRFVNERSRKQRKSQLVRVRLTMRRERSKHDQFSPGASDRDTSAPS